LKRVAPWVKELWIPLAAVLIFITTSFYQHAIIMRLGISTVALLRVVLPYALGIGVWLSFAYLINRFLAIAFWVPLNRRVPVPRLLRDVTALVIYGMAVMGIVGVVFDKPIGPLWAASGASAIVIGLALRNVILDVFIGLAVHFDRPFEIGETIMLAGGPSGRVVELNWRTTRLVTVEGNMVVVPNGKLGELVVTNFSRPNPTGEFELSIFLDLEVPADRALRVLNAAVRSVVGKAGILDEPTPNARIRGVSLQGVEYRIKYHQDPRRAGPGGTVENPLKAPSKAQHEIWTAVLDQLHRAGFQPATPKQDVFHAERPRRQLLTHSLDDRVALLTRVELFEGLTEEERSQLSIQMRERLFREGEILIKSGEHGDSMFILCEGLLEVRMSLKEGQPESHVANLQAGMFFGEMSALTGEPRSATIVAATDALVFEVAKDDIAELIRSRHELAETIAHAVTTRKLRNSEAAAKASTPALTAKKISMTSQLVAKMLSFFGLKPKTRMALSEADQVL
jgi:small-conductance mechanosensitive channel/CRP-like cAMP-binding protein